MPPAFDLRRRHVLLALEHVAIGGSHARPISPDFDFLDANLNLERLPVDELAELRKSEPIHWVDVPGGTGGFGDKGYWIVTKHADVKEVSKRSDVFGSSPDGAIPAWPQAMTRDAIDLQKAVLLNMDAPHHTRLRKIISRGFTPRAVGRLEDELSQRAQNIAKTAPQQGSGDFVEQVSCELPLQAIAGLLGVRRRPRQALPLVHEMTAGEDPEYADVDPAMSSFELITYAMKMAEERSKLPPTTSSRRSSRLMWMARSSRTTSSASSW